MCITKDRKYITAGAVTNKEWIGLCKAINREDLINNSKFNSSNARVKYKVERRKIISEEIAKQTAKSVLRKLQKEQVPSAPILNRNELLKNEQVIENDIIKYFKIKKFGKIRSPRPAPIYSKTRITGKQLAPVLGENSEQILKELKYTKKEINLFFKKQISYKSI